MGDALGAELDRLIADGPLSVAFQPIVHFETDEIVGYEVLGRCAPLAAGPLAPFAGRPDRLLDVAYASGRLLALDRRWRELAIAQIAALADTRLAYFLNVDPRVADDPDHARGYTAELVRRHGLAPERFVLELTELVPAPEPIERVMQRYAADGFAIAIDDLGAGDRSLSTLMRLRADYIKLDRSLISALETDRRRAELVRALAGYAARVGARVIAESIETEAELLAVRDAGVTYGQGYWLGRPGALAAPPPARPRPIARRAVVPDLTPTLLRLIDELSPAADLRRALQHVTTCTQELLGVDRVSLRLLDESRSRLLVAARQGPAIPEDARAEFRVGEGLIGWIVAHGEPLLVGRAEQDPRFAVKLNQVVPVVSFVGVPVTDADGCFGVLSASSPATDRFDRADLDRLRLIAGIVAPHLQIGRLQRLARTDALTGLLNRHALDDVLPELARDDEVVSVALIDLDHFKEINDRFGHAVGDDVLRATAAAIGSVMRLDDCVVRLGGDELLLVLPNVSRETAESIAERARVQIGQLAVAPGCAVTASAGVAQREHGEPRTRLFERVDAALYRAKSEGRNRVAG